MKQSLLEASNLELTICDATGHELEATPDDAGSTPAASVTSTETLDNLADLDALGQLDLIGIHRTDIDGDGSAALRKDTIASAPASTDATEADLLTAPITVDGMELGSITLRRQSADSTATPSRALLHRFARQYGMPESEIGAFLDAADDATSANPQAASRLFQMWASGIVRAVGQEYQLRQRVEELGTLYEISTLIASHRNLQELLNEAARKTAEVMKVKAASIRLLDESGENLDLLAQHNLSQAYVNKGPIVLANHELSRRVLAGETVYIPNFADDERVHFAEEAKREGLVSSISAPLVFQGRAAGLIRLYSSEVRTFSSFEEGMLRAIAQLVAAAVENARLEAARLKSDQIERQLMLAGDVQRRMMPRRMPTTPGMEFAAKWTPSEEVAGDFFDFIDLHDGHVGVAMADVAGHGMPAALLTSAVRASLRAYAQDVYDIDDIIARVNVALSRDTLDNEFATLFYGVIDPDTLRLTYCNAGHEPPLLLRDGEFSKLEVGGMIVGVDSEQIYEKGWVDLQPGDMLLLYSDGLTEAFNFQREKFGRDRIETAMLGAAHLPAEAAVGYIHWQMRCHTGLKQIEDDTTIVVIKVNETGEISSSTDPIAADSDDEQTDEESSRS